MRNWKREKAAVKERKIENFDEGKNVDEWKHFDEGKKAVFRI